MAIDRTGISSLNAGAGEITYSGSEGPKSPEQQLMAQADPMLVEQYQQYVFEMEEQGMQPISFRQFIQQIMSESKMANGGRAGFKYGGGPDFMNTHKPRLMGNPPVMEEIEDAREFRIANPNIEDIADYKSYYERMKKLEQLKKLMQGVKPQPMAYGGSTNPTYSQRRKQRMAYGGVAGADGRKRYGIGSYFQKAKDKFVDDIIPNEIKDNPILSSVIAGTLLNQYGIPFTGTSGDRMGQNWLGDLLSKVPGTGDKTIDMVLGGERGADQIGLGQGMSNIFKTVTGQDDAINKELGRVVGGYPNPDLDPVTLPDGGGGSIMDKIKSGASTVLGKLNPFSEGNIFESPKQNEPANILGPLTMGLSLGALDAATRKDETLPDQPGIDIPAIRAAALQGQGGAFLPPASATTAYANGGRTGYYAGNMVKQNVFSSFSDYKNRGGTKDFMGWYSDNYLPEMPRREREQEAMSEMIREEEDYTLDNWPYGFRKAIPGQDQLGIMTMADGGRIGYATGRNEYLKRLEHLMFLGYDYDSAKEIAQDDDKYQIESTRGLGKAQGGRIGAQEGGLMDLGGMEKDYRQEGGFVPIGGQERADDVPARLSKNEFVFTADAVRSAGGGDIDKGAEVMENVMEHLEQGGQISQDSQGLEGARNMFATAQRLEGVM